MVGKPCVAERVAIQCRVIRHDQWYSPDWSGGHHEPYLHRIDSEVPINQTDNRQLSLTINPTPPPLAITFPTGGRLPNAREDELIANIASLRGYSALHMVRHPGFALMAPTRPHDRGAHRHTTERQRFTRTYTVRDSTLPTNPPIHDRFLFESGLTDTFTPLPSRLV